MPRKTCFEQVSLEVVKKVVKDEIKRAEDQIEPDPETNLAELKQQEKLLATAIKGRGNVNGRKT